MHLLFLHRPTVAVGSMACVGSVCSPSASSVGIPHAAAGAQLAMGDSSAHPPNQERGRREVVVGA
jgi:hypothetical protein